MDNRTNKFDQELKKINHYQNHPQMIPFVGNQWGKQNKKILISYSIATFRCYIRFRRILLYL